MMKKLMIMSGLFLFILAGCDYNEKYFDGYDDVDPTDVKKLEYTLEDADYKTIADNSTNKAIAKENGVESELTKLTSNKYFAEPIDAETYVPAFLASKWISADNGSAVKVTYQQGNPRADYLVEIEQAAGYTVSAADYAGLWGATPANYFTPSKPAANNLPKILAAAITDAESGDYVNVTYNYTDKEPGGESEVIVTIINEDFSTVTVNQNIAFDGWFCKDLTSERNWQGKSYSGNSYAQVSGGGNGPTDSWLITSAIDLATSENPMLSFDICTGYYKGAELSILISEDFNGTDPLTATWVDVTSNFYIPKVPTNGYGVLAPAGIMKLDNYKKKFYLAFRYTGNSGVDPALTATYQIDNLQVGDICTVQENVAWKEDFETMPTEGKPAINLEGWTNNGEKPWYATTFTGANNIYAEATAYNNGEVNTSLITPMIDIPKNGILTFDVNPRYYAGECLFVAISTDLEAGDWIDVTDRFNIPQAQTSDFVTAGYIGLEDYADQKIAVRFTYIGSQNEGVTTTMRIDNVRVLSFSRITTRSANAETRYVGTTVERNAMYQYNGSAWVAAEGISIVSQEDYQAMGTSDFSTSRPPENYLPAYLAQKFPYAQVDDVQVVSYKYFANSVISVIADEYTYTGSVWAKNDNIETVTSQFVKSDGKWNFDPSIVITLTPATNGPMAGYFQTIVDYVKDTYGSDYYQNKSTGGQYTNAEYYYGASAYQGNFDFRVSAWLEDNNAGKNEKVYEEYETDEALTALMYERLQEAFIPALKKYHSDMAPIAGVDVLCTIQFGIYTGTKITVCTHQIQYKVVGAGEFEYVEDSLIELK